MHRHLLLWIALLPACAGAPNDDDPQATAAALAEGSPEAVGVLAFLNGPDATLERLDVAVGLDRRAATNIVAHVAGVDKLRGTGDDDRFDSVAELDAVPYVGATALSRLSAYVQANGLVPDRVVEGVPLFAAQVAAILDVANRATLTQLDVDAGLDARAAKNIIAARPIAGADQLAAVPYVGRAAIEHLRDYAPRFAPPPAECQLALADLPRDDVADLNELLAIATTTDLPAVQLQSLRVTGCPDALTTEEHRAALVAALRKAIDWGYEPGTELPLSDGGIVAGANSYLAQLGASRDVIQERIDDGVWDPQSSQRGAELYARLDALIASLAAPAAQDASGFVEVYVRLEANECSQWATALIDTHTLEIRIVHKMMAC